jgi:phosphatidylserine decarboxylase
METIDTFLKRPDVKEKLKMPIAKILSTELSRDPSRPAYINRDVFYSPADGFVLYAKEVQPDEEIIPVKGGTYSVNTLLREELKERCLVVGIFMSCIDIHIQRAPTNGFFSYETLPTLKVMNLSMRPIETALLERIGINPDEMRYAFYNERLLNKVLMPSINQHYYTLLTADFEVDTICPFRPSGAFFTQCERTSLVRMGSQCDIIIPIKKNGVKFECFIPEDGNMWHVETGVDQIVRIHR